jgi:AraC-like DNA-binding protein
MMENWSEYALAPAVFADASLACLGAGEFRGWNEGFHSRRLRTHAAVLVSAGSGWFESPLTGGVSITAPAVIWLTPGVQHGYGPDRSGWSEHWVLFEGSAARVFEEVAVWHPGAPLTELERVPGSLDTRFAALRTELSSTGAVGSLLASATCYAWLADLAAFAVHDTKPDLIDQFTSASAQRLSMAERARRLGLDVAALREATVARTGFTPLQLLIETRLARAQSLLADTGMSIGDIATRVGFDDQAYFSRQFHRRRGISPRVFRREHRRSTLPGDADPHYETD